MLRKNKYLGVVIFLVNVFVEVIKGLVDYDKDLIIC